MQPARSLSVSATPKENPEPLYPSSSSSSSFRANDLAIISAQGEAKLPALESLQFGKVFSPHMFSVKYSEGSGWTTPTVRPVEAISVHPASSVMQYGVCCFEGMKAYVSREGQVLLFRPEMNMRRFHTSMQRLALPSFDQDELLECIKKLLLVDKSWIPKAEGFSMYLRPFAFGTSAALGVAPPSDAEISIIMSPVGPYFPEGLVPVNVLLDEVNVRAFPQGTGQYKIGGNYAPTLAHLPVAMEHGCKQSLYTIEDGPGSEKYVAECGAMNVFFLLEHGNGEQELVTPPLDGTILPGVTRDSVLSLCREWNEVTVSGRMISVRELKDHASKGTLLEIFGCGTACAIMPIKALVRTSGEKLQARLSNTNGSLLYERLFKTLTDIQYGNVKHPWQEYVL